MKRFVITCLSGSLLIASVAAKGSTTRIVLTDQLGRVTELNDRSVLDQFNLWAGRGTYSGPPDRHSEGTQGFIIDWQTGIVDDRPGQLRRYEVRFYVAPKRTIPASLARVESSVEELAYVVVYENDPATGKGYVYLPGKSDEHFVLNVRSIHRGGLEGHWLQASGAWQTAVTMSLR